MKPNRIIVASAAVSLVFVVTIALQAIANGPNLVPNPSLETASSDPTMPLAWLKGGTGTNTRSFTYPVAGHTGSRAVKTAITNYVDGNSKWYFLPVAVSGGKTYLFSDWYTSNIATTAGLRYQLQDGTYRYPLLSHLPAASAWTQFKKNFTVPTDYGSPVVNVTVFHSIEAVGSLTTDDYSIQLIELVPNPSVETASSNPALPLSWLKGGSGTNARTLTYPVAGHTGSKAIKTAIASYVSGNAKWYFQPITVTGGQTYAFSDWYLSNIPSTVGLRYTLLDGSYRYPLLSHLPAASVWTQFLQDFTVPTTYGSPVSKVTVFHSIEAVGSLTTDDYSLLPVSSSCTADTWTCTAWSACTSGGTQTRSCSLSVDCPGVVTPSPATSQICTPTTAGYTAILSDDGSTDPLPLIADAQDPSEQDMTPVLHVSVPDSVQCPRMLNMVSPAVAIPTTSHIREIEAFWNGLPLPLITPVGEVTEEPHGYGNPIPFFKPLFSTASVPAGSGTLQIRAFDGNHAALTSVDLPNLTVVRPPPPRTSSQIAALAHPRVYLTPARLALIRAKPASDLTVQRFWSDTEGVGYFLGYYTLSTDPESPSFQNAVYDPEGYIPALALCYQLKKTSDPTTAAECADAVKKMTLRIANDYDTGARSFGADSGYNIRFDLRNMLLAYDWMYDQFTAAQRAQMVSVATRWVDWYPTGGYAYTQPIENYYAGYLQGLSLAAIVTAGDNSAGDRLLGDLRAELTDKVPILNQRVCGGDWPEGWGYGPYTTLEFALVNQTLKDVSEDWSADFDFMQPLARSLTYQVTPDLKETVPFGDMSGDSPHSMRPSLLSVLSSTTTDGALATRLYDAMFAIPDSDIHGLDRGSTFYEMAFGNLTSQSADLSALPRSYLNNGSGRYFSKSSLTDAAGYLVTADNVSYDGDHYGFANGDVQFFHGSTCLLCSAAYRGDSFIGLGSTKDFSTYIVDGGDTGVSRNSQMLFQSEAGNWSALGMRFESSYPESRYDQGMMSPAMALDYLIREVVHVRPGILVVRDLHRRRHSADTLVAHWHLGPTQAVQTISPGQYKVGTLNVSAFAPSGVVNSFSSDNDRAGTKFGTLMTQTFPSGTAQTETVTVLSDTATGTSYAGGVLQLSNGQCVTFANGGVNVNACS